MGTWRYLPCKQCREPALAAKSGTLHSASSLSDTSITYLCRRCGRNTRLTATEFQSLPEMTDEQIAHPSCDLPYSTPQEVVAARKA